MKRNLLIGLGAVIVIIILWKLISTVDPPQIWVDNKVSAQLFDKSLNEPVGPLPDSAEIHIDASASMKPYFINDDGTKMINSLAKIRNLHNFKTAVYFLGDTTRYKGTINQILSNVQGQPSDAHSTFHEFFKEQAATLNSNKIVYLITDGIMSIGNDNMNKELVELEGRITNSLKGHGNLAVAVFRYEDADFNPIDSKRTYFNCRNNPVLDFSKVPRHRPYYIIAMGEKKSIRALKSKASELEPPQASLYLGIHDFDGHNKKGTINLKQLESQTDTITLEMQLPSCLQDEVAPSNVIVMNNGKKLDVRITKQEGYVVAIIPPTIPLKEDQDGKTTVIMKARKVLPSKWISDYSTDDDITNGPDSITTFGLKYLITGMSKALEPDTIPLFQMEFKFLK